MKTLSDVDQQILKASEQEFAKNGFHETAVRDIAQRADVGKGTVYRHFGNKKELFGSLIEHATKQLTELMEEILEKSLQPENQLKELLGAHFEYFEDKRHLVEIIVKEGIARTGNEMQLVIQKWENYRSLISSVFQQIDQNYPDWTIDDPEVTSQLFLGWIWGILRDRVIFNDPISNKTYRDQMFRLFINGVKNDE